MISKTKHLGSIILLAIPVLILSIGGIMKLLNMEPEPVMQFLTKMGFSGCIKVLGVTELVIAVLLIYSKTRKIGFLFATGYFGGALSLEISGGQFPASVIFLTILWIALFFSHRDVFILAE